ncbi:MULTISPECIES: InlB B-repeat-containing protein [unclassified Eubacterium (in: firmicutes)]|uniref:InlB B-repeat-containing protein n=1 Tax=unclassified Eubacterium (in: firmicutes) TaxID=2624479 RepID=UPI0015648131|nr:MULTISPECIES: InlB B-repeat-containing protein [unclassified Eubacterium (in: firmicutes)]
MKTNSKILAVVMAFIMIIGLVPISAFAENDLPATNTDTVVENPVNNTEETTTPSDPGEQPGSDEGKAQGDNKDNAEDEKQSSAAIFTVTFDANGHGTAPEAVTVTEGKLLQKPTDPAEDGYTFTGWYRDKEATSKWNFDTDTVTDHTTLYAGWEGNTPAPTRSGMLRNGGTKSEKPPEGITFNIEVISRSGSDGDWRVGDKGKATATVRPEDACKDVIWEAYPEDIVEIDKDGYFTIIKQYDHSGFEYITIYVESLDGSVYHYAQIGRLAPADSNYWSNAIEAVEISECPNTDGMWREGNEGQASVRWKSGVTPRTVTWSASTGENVDIEIDSDGKFRVTRKDLYSQTNVYITATFNVNGVDYSCRSNAIKVFKDKKNVTAVKLIKSPTKLSYVIGEMFDYTGLEVELTYHDGTTGTSVNGEGFHYQPGQDGDWWGPRNTPFQNGDNKVAITYSPYYGDSGTGTIIFNIQVSIPPTYTVSVTNDGNGTGEANPTSGTQGTEVTLTATPNSGYKFDRWVVSNANGGTLSGVTDNPAIFTIGTGHVTIRATFAEDPYYRYAITYHLDGGTNDANNPATYTQFDTITLADPKKDGHTFGGWYDNDAFTGSAITEIPANSKGDKELYAKWTLDTYNISYQNLKGASNSNPVTYTIAITPLTLASLTGGPTGYTFDGWYDNSSFSGNAITEIPANSTGDKTFYAKWTAETYNISYQNLKGASNSNPATYTIDDTPLTLVPLVGGPTGYTFDGWYDNAAFSGNVITEIPANSTGDKTFYAKWTADTYNISYQNVNGASNSNPATYTIADTPLTLVDLTGGPTGHTFDGWYDNASFSGNVITEIPANSTGDKTFYAKWTAETYNISYQNLKGASNSNPTTYTVVDTITLAALPNVTGYTFDGWYDNATFSGSPVTGITANSTGDKTFYAKWTEISYYNAKGNGGEWTKGSGSALTFIFKRSVDDETTFDHFIGIEVDGKAIPEKDSSGKANWTAKKGSVIIELQPVYLETLSVGEHKMAVQFDDGADATATFTVKQNPPQPTISYTAKDGSGNTIQSVTWQKGSGKNLDLTFKRSEDDHLTYGLFGSLEIGGVTVGSANYGAAEGSLKLSIKPEYLETLSVGDHTVKVNFQDGSATVKLTVLAASAQPTPSPTPKPSEKPTSPKTGDESNLTLWSSLMFLSVAAMIVLLLYARKRKTEK